MQLRHSFRLVLLAVVASFFQVPNQLEAQNVVFQPKSHVALIGNALADRMQHHAWLETYLHALYPKNELTFRNLAFPADSLKNRQRSQSFGNADEWLTKVEADIVLCFFGFTESFGGQAGLQAFKADLAELIDQMRSQKYNGNSAPQLVFFSPIAHENVKRPTLPDGSQNNVNLELYTEAMQQVCAGREVQFVDLFHPTLALYDKAKQPLTMNGIHLLEHGNQALAGVIISALHGNAVQPLADVEQIDRLRQAVLNKNLHWFSRYRVVDGYNVYGGRSKLNWFGQSNADVMKREMAIFDVLTANRDNGIWSVAQGGDSTVIDDNLPRQLQVRTNKPGSLADEKHPYLTAEESLKRMKMADGMKVNVFASEEMFPELANPVQMAVDTDGRLFASVWPSYPHWNPTEPRNDRILCLPDEDRDGVADRCIIFADELNSITGFEFWGGGMLVAAPPEIWFLKDTDGDDQADIKVRMLQGLSSADTHHSANALVIGPDGGLYWSRGIFNVANMETPTGIFRSNASGVYRFDPRTFQMSFHFPIGPNPHGDVFDQWGYQFANDGTSGTGSYVNIGKGQGNKQWFNKRVRPVSATGILSSTHFPEENNGNFLICNCIGFLGVLQHEVKYNGADITAVEVDPILVSSDPNFRPTDIEVGGDGAIYVSDWCNVLIGHMQHNMRDPNRDHKHGRIYRVTYEGRPLVEPVRLKNKPIKEVLAAFYKPENGIRYRARLELSGRPTAAVTQQVAAWADTLDINDPLDAQALLEGLWVFEEHRVVNLELLKTVFQAEEPRIRAAAIRTLGHWGPEAKNWQPTLVAAARDPSPLVRAEAVKAAVSFPGLAGAEIVFETATRPTDVELDKVLNFARQTLKVDQIVTDAVKSGSPLSTAAQSYVLRNATIADLLKLKKTEAVYLAIISRPKATVSQLRAALTGLATMKKIQPLPLVLDLIEQRDAQPDGSLAGLGQLLSERPAAELQSALPRLEALATAAKQANTRRLGFTAWIASGHADDALLAASQNKDQIRSFLEAVPGVANDQQRAALYSAVEALTRELPAALTAESGGSSLGQAGIKVDYYFPHGANAARETLARMTPKASGIVPQIVINVPQRKQPDRFSLRFSGFITVPRTGKYTFFSNSDDGSRIYVANKEVVNNDGNHGPIEKSGTITLPAGSHPLLVTYFDSGGGDALSIKWSGPGIKKQAIPAAQLSVGGGETLHDVAIRSLGSIPGNEEQKFTDLTALVKSGLNRPAAIRTLRGIAAENWPGKEIRPLVDNLVGYLSEMPARYRTGAAATDAIALATALSAKLPAPEAEAIGQRLQNLDVRVIAVGTVPHRMIFDKELIVIQAGKPVEFRFSNTDNMPHNFAIVQPGSLEEIGLMAEATARDPDAMARHYIPDSDKVMLASRLIQPGELQAVSFDAPKTPGIYPYVCTYPGHWRRMYGALYVVKDLEQYQADPAAYLANNPLPILDDLLKRNTRGQAWKFEDLLADVNPLPPGRSFEVGRQLFKVASCVACHKLNDEGQQFGPDLAKLDDKKHTTSHILRSMLEPSKEIDDKFASYAFLMASGKVVTGMIVEETPEVVKIVIDPVAKASPTILPVSEIEARKKSPVSMMPKGVLDRLSREEILDLIAYVFAAGNPKHELFESHHDH